MSKARILVVEDEQIIALDVKATLESCGYIVVGQTDRGDDAILKTAELHPDLVLMDIGLKGEMNGIESAAQIRARYDLPVIFLTAFADHSTVGYAREAEPFGYVLKPFEENELTIAIEMAFYKHGMERKLRESEGKFRNVIEHASDGIVLLDSQGNLIEWNPAMEKITGLKCSDVLGHPVAEVVFPLLPKQNSPEDLKKKNNDQWKQAVQSRYSILEQMAEREIEDLQGVRRIIQSNGFTIQTAREKLAGAIIRDITESKRAEIALKESEERFRSFLQGVESVSVQGYGPDGTTQYWNQASERLYGYSAQEALGRNLLDLIIPPEMRQDVSQAILEMAKTGRPAPSSELSLMRKDGSRVIVFSSHAIVKLPGQVQELFCIDIDITERKLAEAALRESETRYRELIELAADGILIGSHEGIIIGANSSMLNLAGRTAGDLLGAHVSSLFHADDLINTPLRFDLLKAGKTVISERHLFRPDGSSIPVEMHTKMMPNGTYQSIYHDITERKRTEETVKNSEKRFRAMIENGRDRISLLAVDGTLLWESPSNVRTLGYAPDQFVGHNIFELMHPEDKDWTLTMFAQVAREPGNKQEGIFRLLQSSGAWRWVEATATNLLHEPNIKAIIINYRDITDRKNAEEALSRSEALYRQAIEVAGAVPYHQTYPEHGDNIIYDFIGEGIREITGYGPEEFTEDLWDSLMQERILLDELAELEFPDAIQKVRLGNYPIWKCEHRIKARDGKIHWVFEAAVELRDENGEAHGSIGTFQDITARKQLEQLNLEQRRLAECLRDTSAALSSTLKSDEVFDRILDNIGRLITYDTAMVLLIEGPTVRKIHHKSTIHAGSEDQSQLGNTQANLINIPILNEIIETRQPCLIPDTQADIRWRTIPDMGWIRSFISAPIQIRGQVAGLINVVSAQPGFFTPESSRRIMAFADQAAIAIENAQLFEQTQYLAMTDPLTELYNRRYFFDIARLEFERIQRTRRPLSIMMMDIDRFKNINDTHGHAMGDLVLHEIAARIKCSVRTMDIAARYGGEEFIVLMPETNLAEAFQVAERVRRSIADTCFESEDVTVNATLSIGVAESDENITNMDKLIIFADQALYLAKAAGRDRVVRYQKV